MKVTIELDVDTSSEYSLVEAEKTIRFLKKTHFPRTYRKKPTSPEPQGGDVPQGPEISGTPVDQAVSS